MDGETPERGQRLDAGLIERAMEASGTALAISGPNLELSYVNRAFLRLWGYERPEQALGRLATDFWKDVATAEAVVTGAVLSMRKSLYMPGSPA